ncbi:NAD(P)/FAD-dependent oxidoreductase [Steroidobacter cummioxidans]|uniref:NAD(P)/FAD-dependent oxidoreductase n=1 Tax=Steroidobacter cummioxidans TaxID=1803913 RepID=UPI000E30F839|nr:tryptophan 7-halogenase [Steroidobacter cummioxidans]
MNAPSEVAKVGVTILGGGLAGLTLAIQLHRQFPSLSIRIIERRRHPVPPAAHKVGESSVEIGAHYFDTVLGLKEHLNSQQLKKFGFRFFFSEGREDLDSVTELGASRYLSTPSYQLDRGVFENYLGEHVRELGVEFIDGAVVRSFDIGTDGAEHVVRYEAEGLQHEVRSRWLIDASGRAGLIKRKLSLQQDNAHNANAIWFRIGTKIDVDEWSADAAWLNRCDPPYRWLSTNHLCGEGYWAWLIPLSSGSHSVGIVCDAVTHPLETMNTFEKALEWFRVHQPRLARELEGKQHLLQDFCFLRNFSYGCKQVFSGDRWALTGEAGVFLDPFYSPGSDFIGISNSYITDLIARDLQGELINGRAHVYQQIYFSFYESTLALYTNQYAMFGDPEVMPVKVIWDYTYYWGVLCQLFFQRRLTDLANLSRLSDHLNHSRALNVALQNFMREWSKLSARRNDAVLLDQASLPWFAELNRGLRDELDEEAFRARMIEYTGLLNALAVEIIERACGEHPSLDATEVRQLLSAVAPTMSESLLFTKAA